MIRVWFIPERALDTRPEVSFSSQRTYHVKGWSLLLRRQDSLAGVSVRSAGLRDMQGQPTRRDPTAASRVGAYRPPPTNPMSAKTRNESPASRILENLGRDTPLAVDA
jgi:hypothetical protein